MKNVDQLRTGIDHGYAGDKVRWSDPAAAPLGTDDEAGGHSPMPEQVDVAFRQEIGSNKIGDKLSQPYNNNTGLGHAWWLVGIIALFALCIITLPFII